MRRPIKKDGQVFMDPILSQKRAEYCRELDDTCNRTVQYLVNLPEVELVVLFGSYAKGKRDLFTDLDFLLVMQSEKDFVARTAELYQQLPVKVDVDLFVYTPEEFERMKKRGFVKEALRTGKVLYEKRSS